MKYRSIYSSPYYGGPNGEKNYNIQIGDAEPDDMGYFPYGSNVYTFDTYSLNGTSDGNNYLPAAGTYTVTSGNTDLTVDPEYSTANLTDVYGYIEEGTVVISYDDENMYLEASVTDSKGNRHHVTYSGPIEGNPSGGDDEEEYDKELEADYISMEYSGENGAYRFYTKLSDSPIEDVGMFGAFGYYLDIYSTVPADPVKPLPATGTYTLEYGTSPMTLGKDNTMTSNLDSFSEGTADISYEGDNIVIECVLTRSNGETHHITYSGPVSVIGGEEPEPENLTIYPTSVQAYYNWDENDVMEVEFTFSNLQNDGYYNIGPGNELTIVAYLPFDQDGNIPANTYSVNESGALYTIQPGSTYENFWGGLEYEGSYFGIYPEGSYYPETYYVLNGGSMTVSGSSSNYSVEFNFTAEDGSTVTGSYTGAINIEGIPGPYSCLTSDYTLDLAGTVANTAKYGDMYGYGVDNFELELAPESGNGDGFFISLYTPSDSNVEGIPSGTYYGNENAYKEGGWTPGSYSYSFYGTHYYVYEDGWKTTTAAPAKSGEFTVENHGDGTYTLTFAFVDDKGYTWSGKWEGNLNISEW